MRVIVDQSSLHRLAILRVGVLRPGIFLMAGVGLERDFLVLFGELKFAWRQVKEIWYAASTDWLSRSVLDIVSRCLPLRAVQWQAYTLQ